jgi:hypothetical protein
MPISTMRDRLVYRVFHSLDEDAPEILMALWEKQMLASDPDAILDRESAQEQANDLIAAVADDGGFLAIAPSGRIEIISRFDIAAGWEDTGQDIVADVLAEALQERHEQINVHGYTPEHDAQHGSGHLVDETVYTLTHFGETPTNEHVRHELIKSIAMLISAVEVIDRTPRHDPHEGEQTDHGGFEDH